ncbi:AAA family ATPase [Ktedonosporobacter rubrisoli]|uniref:AAA family ATPase n=1 Tax=Ktedonosporobacter rubrisoli TaxID=2509675 RepID=A0A4V0Z0K9_KTERU|nr:AAA family ATPase [Ktedonosporobacter rubrisoli]
MVGVEGSGKTTLARQLARRLGLPHVELDALYWDANWTRVSPHLFRERVAQVLDAECWITDGNYDAVRDLIWGRADTVVWLDYPLRVVVPRLVWRSVRHSLTGEELWNGNRGTLVRSLLARDSLLAWVIKTSSERRKSYLAAQHDPTWAHLDIIRLQTPRMTQVWVSQLPANWQEAVQAD